MKQKLGNFDTFVVEELKDPKFAAAYLKESWEYQGEGKLELLLKALHRIALAKGMTQLARDSGISRRNLYKMFSASGNPSAKTLLIVMNSLGVKLTISETEKAKPRKKVASW